MICKDVSFTSPLDNILYDDVLLQMAEEGTGDEVLRFWESSSFFVVLGKIGRADEDIEVEAVQKLNIPVLRRSSGGGTVVQGPGCLNYSLVLQKDRKKGLADLKQSYALILEKVTRALAVLGVKAEYLSISDIALQQTRKKISGNAQKRRKTCILHHGTILYDFDLNLIDALLKIPRDMPDYRQKRGHLDFVANVPVTAEALKEALRDIFGAREEGSLNETEQKHLERLKTEKQIVVPMSV